MLIRIIIFAATAIAASGASAEAGQLVLTEDSIQAVHPMVPRDTVSDTEASCGTTRFGVTLHYRHGQWAQRLQSVRAGGNDVTAVVRRAISGSITSTTMIMNAYIDQCSRTDPSRARLRLNIVDRPWQGNQMRFLDVWIGPDGSISEVRFN